jgi:prepilin-type processing-associated H-X9-DG protein
MFIGEGQPGVDFPQSLEQNWETNNGHGYIPVLLSDAPPENQVVGGTHYVPSGGSFVPWYNPSPTWYAPGDNDYFNYSAGPGPWAGNVPFYMFNTYQQNNHVGQQQFVDYCKKYKGVYTYNTGTPAGQILDGTSNTIAFMEQHGGNVGNGGNYGFWQTGWINQVWASGVLYLNYGVCPDPNNKNCWSVDDSPGGSGLPVAFSRGAPTFGLGAYAAWPGSMHGGNMMNVAMADGSVRRLNDLPGLWYSGLLWSLAGIADGDAAGLPD